jgi:hypothetical protein
MGPTEVGVKFILRRLVIEIEDNSNPGGCVTSFAQCETVHGRRLCLSPGPLVNVNGFASKIRPQIRASATLPSGYAPGFRSISTIIRFTSWENFGSGSRSFGRCPGSYDTVRTRNITLGIGSDYL